MGERNSTTEVIILSIQPKGENNRSVCAFSPELGIFYSTLYGGAKSKMRALVQPFNTGKIWLYSDESKNMRKISDFDVKNYHPTLRTSLYKIWAANLASEIVLKTKGAGDDKASFRLLTAFIDGIDNTDENGSKLGTIRFLWRYLNLLGIQPDVCECVECKRSLLSGSSIRNGNTRNILYLNGINGFICSDCLQYSEQRNGLFIDIEGLTYLASINELSPGKVRELIIEAESVYKLKQLVFGLIEQACGTPLKSLESGFGIL